MKCLYTVLSVCLVIVLLFSFAGCASRAAPASFAPQHEGYINYNNYVSDGHILGNIDYRYGTLVYSQGLFKNVFKADGTGKQEKIKDLSASALQLSENGIVYKCFSELKYRDLNGNEMLIDKNVFRFMVYKSFVVYERYARYDETTEEYFDDDLYLYDLLTGATEVLFEDPTEYVIYNDCVYVTDSTFDASLYKISFDTREKQFVYRLEISVLPYTIQISDDTLVLYGTEEDSFYLLDLNTLQESTLLIHNGLHDVRFICEGDTIYYSYRGIIRDGSINYTDHKNEHNGTWKINRITGERERISEQFFYKLYCFDKTHLYGTNKNGITKEIMVE